MSTKIYNAYRLPKETDILKVLKQAKNIATEMVANEEDYLKFLHAMFFYNVDEKLKKEPNNKFFLKIKEENINNEFHYHDLEFFMFLEGNEHKVDRMAVSAKFDCSVFYDENYWYLKFFPNERIENRMLDKFKKELNFEDYHYQNQVDTPDDIPEEEYMARGKKWDELTKESGGNYLDGFTYNIMGANVLKELIRKNYYTGNPLYEHLAYKFDTVFFEKEKE
jgi:hypothetical protein